MQARQKTDQTQVGMLLHLEQLPNGDLVKEVLIVLIVLCVTVLIVLCVTVLCVCAHRAVRCVHLLYCILCALAVLCAVWTHCAVGLTVLRAVGQQQG